jgi:hypothetical protein
MFFFSKYHKNIELYIYILYTYHKNTDIYIYIYFT